MRSLFIIFILIFNFSAWSQESPATPDQTAKAIKYVKDDFLHIIELKSEFPKFDHTSQMNFLGFKILDFENSKKRGTVFNLKESHGLYIDYATDQCNKGQGFCDVLAERKARYKKDYNIDYTPRPIVYPEINLENMTYTMPNGIIYDVSKAVVVKGSAEPKVTSSNTIPVVPPKVASGDPTVKFDNEQTTPTPPATEQENINSDEKICEWDESRPRRSLSGQTCNTRVCSSWVVCTKNGKKRRALASCSMDFCVEGKATECVAQKGYGSIKLDFKKMTTGGKESAPAKNEKSNR